MMQFENCKICLKLLLILIIWYLDRLIRRLRRYITYFGKYAPLFKNYEISIKLTLRLLIRLVLYTCYVCMSNLQWYVNLYLHKITIIEWLIKRFAVIQCPQNNYWLYGYKPGHLFVNHKNKTKYKTNVS